MPVQSRQPIVVLFSKIALDPCAHVAALAALLPFAQEEDQSRAFEAFVRHNFLPRSAFETQCINALLASLRSRSQALRLPPDATSYLIKLHSACKVAQAGALLADVLGDQMPQATSTYPKQLIDQQAVAVANHWLKVVLSSPNFKEDPCDLRCLKPALALTGSDASKHVHGLCTKVIETQKDVSNVLDLVQFAAKIQRLTDDTATLLIPSLPKILAERFSSGCSLAAVLCKTVSLQSSVVDHVASVLKSKQPNEISASTVVSIAQLSNHLPTSHATHLISELLQKAYLWLVRRFAEDVEDTTETLSLVDSLSG